MTRALSRLGLGTVQFGQAYGVSNARGRVPVEDVERILSRAAGAGLRTLDTAAGYGEAEAVLGGFTELTRPFRIVTKTIAIKNGLDAVVARARESVTTLGRPRVDLLLVHAAGDLMGAQGDALWQELLKLRDEGLFGDIGISAYVLDDPVGLARRFRPAAMQIPFSILDQRLLQSGALEALKELGVEIHARSLFLQGLLFLPADKLPSKLAHVARRLVQIRQELAEAGVTPLEAALAFVLSQEEIDVGLVGVTGPNEFEDILTSAQTAPRAPLDWQRFALDDPLVLTPSLW